ncbi:C-type lectin domain family 10 member A isoform X2 [Centropristis striata]|uniref:C-type lectin domain family 10 member A isoform X2 n=1 Tax=Centropristis striata TaxID=184440 RepID=UPI0027DFA14D|nr:C-type lectin domain family 10 member A isoform X2 [Centropristis striata]
MMTDNQKDRETDRNLLWITEPAPVSLSGVSRFRRWLCPALVAAVVLILIIAMGASKQRVSNLRDQIRTLNASLQHAEENATEVKLLQSAVEENRDQLISVAEALKQLSVLDSLSRSVDALKCSLERIINNSSAEDGCCPISWEQFDTSCYFFSHQSLTWNESQVHCDQHGAHLLILQDDKEWDFVTRRTVNELYWVGLSDWRTGQWEWVNRTPYTIERRRWVPGQPDSWTGHGLGHGDEDCAHLHFNGRLNDLHCSSRMRFICQRHSRRA